MVSKAFTAALGRARRSHDPAMPDQRHIGHEESLVLCGTTPARGSGQPDTDKQTAAGAPGSRGKPGQAEASPLRDSPRALDTGNLDGSISPVRGTAGVCRLDPERDADEKTRRWEQFRDSIRPRRNRPIRVRVDEELAGAWLEVLNEAPRFHEQLAYLGENRDDPEFDALEIKFQTGAARRFAVALDHMLSLIPRDCSGELLEIYAATAEERRWLE